MNKIARIKITAYRGIEALDVAVPPSGAIAKGSNGRGKTTIIKAIRAALAAQDVGPDAIRNGSEKAEILVDLDRLQVRRAITKKGTSVTVTQDMGNGVRGTVSSPQTFLTQLLGTSPLDPLDLFLEKADRRRAKILAALPVSVTIEQLQRWAPDLPADTDVSGHGLDVIALARKAYYTARTDANAGAKKAVAEAERAKAAAAELAAKWPGIVMSSEQAQAAEREAGAALASLQAREAEAAASAERTAKTRARVAALRDESHELSHDLTAPGSDDEQVARDDFAEWTAKVGELEQLLEQAKNRLADAGFKVQQIESRREQVNAAQRRARMLADQADELEAAIKDAAVERPVPESIAQAREALEKASAAVQDAQSAEEAIEARRHAEALAKAADEASRNADRLDGIVSALTNDAPAALLADSDGIPGLTLDGDDIYLDGVHIERGLSGMEQMRFAVEIARRANAKSKILVVDGLERLDPDQLDEFVKLATADDWQLIATRVDRGEVVLEAIQPAARSNGVEVYDAAHA